jgi:hypothetical protein
MSFTEEVVISKPSRDLLDLPKCTLEFPFESGAWKAKIDQNIR